MPFQPGHKHGAKSRMFEGALKRAIAQDDGERLRKAAEQLLDQAAAGEQWAIQYLADRLDGKAAQSVTVETKSVREMSLAELTAQLAAIADGSSSTAGSADQPDALH